MHNHEAVQLERQHIVQTYARAPLVLTRGEGITLYDADGRAYLDFSAGIAVNALGHADPEITRVIAEQAGCLIHTCNLYYTEPQAQLARDLCEASFADRVFFCNSGTEAIEAAIKFARKVAYKRGDHGKTGIVAFEGAFHGRTMGALALTAREKYQAPFRPLMPGVAFAPFNDVDAAARAIGPETCAVFVEPVQGEGGIHVAEPEFLRALRALCDRHQALLVFDEVQCGMGRTGHLWAHEASGVTPDIMALAKPLAGGLPIGATLVTEQVASAMEIGEHGSTFAGGPLVTSVARAVLRRVSDPAFLAHVREVGAYLMEGLQALNSAHITDIRGRGLIVGVELDVEVAPVVSAGYDAGLILLNAGPNVLRLVPPLIVEKQHVDVLVGRLGEILEGLADGRA